MPGRDAVAGGEWRGLGLTAPVRDRGISLLMQSEPTYHACMAQTIASHIEIRPNRDGQDRAFVDGTRVRVHDVAVLAELHGQTPDQIAEALPHLSLAQIHAALSYYFDHRVEIQQELKDDAEFVERFKTLVGSGPLELRLKSVSSSFSKASK